MNKDETNAINIWALRDRSIPWEGIFELKWATDFDVLGIKYRINHMDSITDDNISTTIADIKKLIAIWNTRNLTPYGKVVITKSLLF